MTEGSDPRPLAWLRERAEVIEIGATHADFDDALPRADGMIVRTYTRVTEPMLARAPRLKVVGRGGVGLENIDVAACRSRGVEVVYTPDANTAAVGDYVFGVMLQLIRPWARFRERAYGSDEFKQVRTALKGRQLNELTLGILGFGRVGRRVGSIAANGFGMRVIYNDLLPVESGAVSFAATNVDKPALFRETDVLTIHVDMRPGNRHLVGAAQIGAMKRGAVLLNTSRGEVLDAFAVADAIRSGRLSGAALDVFDPEPPPADFPLLGFDNVILTPHMASRTAIAIENMGWVVRDVAAVLEGAKPKFPAP
ncbi:MAG TPA: NAD(P)-dependent oxidoreductase [Tepidisphaeraceae bacterium]|nr:NAD(P)-dependent oxidoreductase [Tepidisphaeraceae bacterium]